MFDYLKKWLTGIDIHDNTRPLGLKTRRELGDRSLRLEECEQRLLLTVSPGLLDGGIIDDELAALSSSNNGAAESDYSVDLNSLSANADNTGNSDNTDNSSNSGVDNPVLRAASTITVTTSADAVLDATGQDADTATTSLREAIYAANQNTDSTVTTIQFDGGITSITLNAAAGGQLTINESTTIDGLTNHAANSKITVTRDINDESFRIFEIASLDTTVGSTPITVLLSNLTISHGDAQSGSALSGGGVYIGPNSDVTFSAITVTECEASMSGGGVYLSKDASLTISGHTFLTHNEVFALPSNGLKTTLATTDDGGVDAGGGGIFVGGTLTVSANLLIQFNNAGANAGGAIYLDGTGKMYSVYTVTNDVLSENDILMESNKAQFGGGIFIGAGATYARYEAGDPEGEDQFFYITKEYGLFFYDNGSETSDLENNVYATLGGASFNDGYAIFAVEITLNGRCLTYDADGNRVYEGGNVKVRGELKTDHAYDGGAIYNRGVLAMDTPPHATGTPVAAANLTISGYHAAHNGGGIYSSGMLVLRSGTELEAEDLAVYLTVDTCSAGNNGGGIYSTALTQFEYDSLDVIDYSHTGDSQRVITHLTNDSGQIIGYTVDYEYDKTKIQFDYKTPDVPAAGFSRITFTYFDQTTVTYDLADIVSDRVVTLRTPVKNGVYDEYIYTSAGVTKNGVSVTDPDLWIEFDTTEGFTEYGKYGFKLKDFRGRTYQYTYYANPAESYITIALGDHNQIQYKYDGAHYHTTELQRCKIRQIVYLKALLGESFELLDFTLVESGWMISLSTKTEFVIRNCTALNGGGVYNTGSVDPDGTIHYAIINNYGSLTISGNTATVNADSVTDGRGGGVYNDQNGIVMDRGSLKIIGNFTTCTEGQKSKLCEGTAGSGAGLFNIGDFTSVPLGSNANVFEVRDNTAVNMGGGVYNAYGGQLYLVGAKTGTIDVSYEYNETGYTESVDSYSAKINDNKSGSQDFSYVAYGGGGILNMGEMILENVEFRNNQAHMDYVAQKSDIMGGGAIRNTNLMQIRNATFSNNSSLNGGAVLNTSNYYTGFQKTNGSFIVYGDLDFVGNRARHQGGAFYNDSDNRQTGGNLQSFIGKDDENTETGHTIQFIGNQAGYYEQAGKLYSGGGAILNRSLLYVWNADFKNNESDTIQRGAEWNGGGAISLQGGELHIDNCLIDTNQTNNGANGGGISLSDKTPSLYARADQTITGIVCSFIVLNDGRIAGRTLEEREYVSTGVLEITNNTANGGSGGGIYSNTPGSIIDLRGKGTSEADYTVKITGNSANGITAFTLGGGGVYTQGITMIKQAVISGNSTAAAGGGGINVYRGTTTLENVSVHDNTALGKPGTTTGGNGGGIFIGEGAVIGTGTILVYDNQTSNQGGGIFLANRATNSLTLTGNAVGTSGVDAADYSIRVYNNQSGMGIPPSETGGSTRSVNTSGGGGLLLGGKATLTNILVTGNTADFKYKGSERNGGGGIHIQETAVVTLKNGKVTGNTVTTTNNRSGVGGGIYLASDRTLTIGGNTIVSANSAGQGGGMYIEGILRYEDENATLSVVNNNTALQTQLTKANQGAGLYLASTAQCGEIVGRFFIDRSNMLQLSGNGTTDLTTGGGIYSNARIIFAAGERTATSTYVFGQDNKAIDGAAIYTAGEGSINVMNTNYGIYDANVVSDAYVDNNVTHTGMLFSLIITGQKCGTTAAQGVGAVLAFNNSSNTTQSDLNNIKIVGNTGSGIHVMRGLVVIDEGSEIGENNEYVHTYYPDGDPLYPKFYDRNTGYGVRVESAGTLYVPPAKSWLRYQGTTTTTTLEEGGTPITQQAAVTLLVKDSVCFSGNEGTGLILNGGKAYINDGWLEGNVNGVDVTADGGTLDISNTLISDWDMTGRAAGFGMNVAGGTVNLNNVTLASAYDQVSPALVRTGGTVNLYNTIAPNTTTASSNNRPAGVDAYSTFLFETDAIGNWYTLGNASPAVDTGDNDEADYYVLGTDQTVSRAAIDKDLAGHNRILSNTEGVDAIVDLGAFERATVVIDVTIITADNGFGWLDDVKTIIENAPPLEEGGRVVFDTSCNGAVFRWYVWDDPDTTNHTYNYDIYDIDPPSIVYLPQGKTLDDYTISSGGVHSAYAGQTLRAMLNDFSEEVGGYMPLSGPQYIQEAIFIIQDSVVDARYFDNATAHSYWMDVTLNPEDATPTFDILWDDVSLDVFGLNIVRGNDSSGWNGGGAFTVATDSVINLFSVYCADCYGTNGGAIYGGYEAHINVVSSMSCDGSMVNTGYVNRVNTYTYDTAARYRPSVFERNEAVYGGAICVLNSKAELSEDDHYLNIIGIDLAGKSWLKYDDTLDAFGRRSGAGTLEEVTYYNDGLGEVIQYSNLFVNNSASEMGGAVYGRNTYISGAAFIENSVDNKFSSIQGGGAVFASGKLEIKSADFLSNTSNVSGGAIAFAAGTMILSGNIVFAGNSVDYGVAESASANVGGAIYVDNSAHLYMVHVTGTTARDLYQGGLRTTGGYCCEFLCNEAYEGGAVYLMDSGDSMLRHVLFERNTAVDGAGLFVDNSGLTIEGCTFAQNYANRWGGGAYFQYITNESDVSSNTFENNWAGRNGGAYYSNTAKITGAVAGDNYVENPGKLLYIYDEYCSVGGNASEVRNNKQTYTIDGVSADYLGASGITAPFDSTKMRRVSMAAPILAVIEPELNVYEALEPEQVVMPQSAARVSEWDSLYVELWTANDFEGRRSEDLTLTQTITYNPNLYRLADPGSVPDGVTIDWSIAVADSAATVTVTITLSTEFLTEQWNSAASDAFLGSLRFVPTADNGSPLTDATQDGAFILAVGDATIETKVEPVKYDIDRNGRVDMTDFIQFAQLFNAQTASNSDAARADFNNDGTVDMTDFIAFAEHFNSRVQTEPTELTEQTEQTDLAEPMEQTDSTAQAEPAIEPVASAAVETAAVETAAVETAAVETAAVGTAAVETIANVFQAAQTVSRSRDADWILWESPAQSMSAPVSSLAVRATEEAFASDDFDTFDVEWAPLQENAESLDSLNENARDGC